MLCDWCNEREACVKINATDMNGFLLDRAALCRKCYDASGTRLQEILTIGTLGKERGSK